MALHLPFNQGAGRCYREVEKLPVFGPGLQLMKAWAEKALTFEARLEEIRNSRFLLVREYRSLARGGDTAAEEEDFGAAVADLLEAMFFAEVQRLEHETDANGQRLDDLRRLAEHTDLDPAWNAHACERIAARIQAVRSSSGTDTY